jgi:hypothetical protein
MAIDFGRMARGVATGYLSAKIANTEANDRLKEDIVRGVGENYLNNTLPEFQKNEKKRQDTYNKVKARYGVDVANYMDQNNFTDYDEVVAVLSEGDSFNEAKLKAYLEATQAGTYSQRAEKRFKSMEDQQNFIMNNMTKNGFGVNTLKNQLGFGMPKEEAMVAEAPKVEGEMPAAPAPTEDTTTTKLPSFEEIFGVEQGVDRTYTSLKDSDQMSLRTRALAEFNAIYKDELTGDTKIPPAIQEAYKNLPEAQQKSLTVEQFAFDNFFRNKFLPDSGFTYTKTLPSDIVEAKALINQYRSIGDEDTVKIIKQRLIDAGYDIRDYNL